MVNFENSFTNPLNVMVAISLVCVLKFWHLCKYYKWGVALIICYHMILSDNNYLINDVFDS